MEKIFYTKRSAFASSEEAVKKILQDHFGYSAPKILRTENGKSYLAQPITPLFFSVSHTQDALFIAFCDENVGLDVEQTKRSVNYLPIIQKFPDNERQTIATTQDFLRHFTAKESAIKWLGGKLSSDFSALSFIGGKLFYKDLPLPVCVTLREYNGFFLTVCSEKDFSNAEIVTL